VSTTGVHNSEKWVCGQPTVEARALQRGRAMAVVVGGVGCGGGGLYLTGGTCAAPVTNHHHQGS
jgi:hypothetical protein